MRIGRLVTVIVVVWLIIGAIAVWQRGYFKEANADCASAGTIAVTVIAGPLNYAGVNPKVNCEVPQPSQ
jgi:DNA-binding transcriptional regulator of glucitol operon